MGKIGWCISNQVQQNGKVATLLRVLGTAPQFMLVVCFTGTVLGFERDMELVGINLNAFSDLLNRAVDSLQVRGWKWVRLWDLGFRVKAGIWSGDVGTVWIYFF